MAALPSTLASDPPPASLRLAFAVAALGAIVGASLDESLGWHDGRWLYWLCKPLATALVFVLVWRTAAPVSPVYRRRLLAGIACSWVGDVFLMLSPVWFVAGLLGFLLAHLFFIAAFLSDKPWAARPLPWLLCLGYGVGAAWLLWPALDAVLRIAVPLYIAVLASMGGQAIGRALWLRDAPTAPAVRLAGIGALVFMASDSMLAWNRFMTPLPWAAAGVLGTYYVAMWLIGRSADARAGQRASARVAA